MRRVFSTLLYLVLGLPLALSALLLLSARPWALDRDFYKRFVADERLYAALRAPEMPRSAPALVRRGDASFDGPALVTAIQKNLPEAEIKAFGVRAVDGTFDILEGRVPAGPLSLDTRALKTAFKSRGPAIAADYVAAIPSRPGIPAAGDYTWRPESLSIAAFRDKATVALRATVDGFPDSLTAPMERPPATRPHSRSAVVSQTSLDRAAAGTAAAAALLIAGLAALGGGGLVRSLSRAGSYVLVPSVLVLAVGVVLAVPGGLILGNMMPAEARDFLGGQAGAQLRAYLANVLGQMARGFFVTGLVGASLGGALASARRWAEPRES